MKICRSVYQHVEGRGIFKAYNRRPGSGHV